MLDKKQHYLQIALNSTLDEAQSIVNLIPLDKRIIIEAGTPLIKAYGVRGIRAIRSYWEGRFWSPQPGLESFKLSVGGPWWLRLLTEVGKKPRKIEKRNPEETTFTPYIVADLKCMDRGMREVEIAREGGANAVTALGQAPIETLDAFIEKCEEYGLDAMIDMMNVDFPLNVLRQLKKIPEVVVLHRGVDEEAFNPEKEIPFHEIQRIKSNYDIMIAVAGGDTFEEARRAIFNDADIVVVWKSFYESSADTAKLAQEFLKEIR
jgi:bifunctional enzyme Fae/Hps